MAFCLKRKSFQKIPLNEPVSERDEDGLHTEEEKLPDAVPAVPLLPDGAEGPDSLPSVPLFAGRDGA